MRVLYLTSEYPGISHTFILREIEQLRSSGATVRTASIRRPANLDKMPDLEKKEASQTLYIKPHLTKQFPPAFLRLLGKAPYTLTKMLARAGLWCVTNGPRSPFKAMGYWLEAVVLLDHLLTEHCEHVHVHFANPAATVAMLAALHPSVKFSMSVHGPDIFYDTTTNLLALKVERAEFVRCISHYCRSQLMRLVAPHHWSKLRIVRCGVDVDAFAPPQRPSGSHPVSNQASGGPTGPLRILCVGRICVAKAQPILVRACACLAEDGKDFQLTFVGGGEGLEELQAIVKIMGLSDRVVFTGPVGQDVAREAYDRADLFVLPSFAEGVPVVLMEAMAKKIPCISTMVHGIPELITNKGNGLLVFPGDVTGLAQAIARLMASPAERERLGTNGRETILSEYDLQANSKHLVGLLQNVAGD